MAIEFVALTDEERAAAEVRWQREAEDERARLDLVTACRDSGGHEWEMELYHPEDDCYVSLNCVRCPAGIDDLYPDGVDLLYAEFEDGVLVEQGRHNSPVPLIVPVTAEVSTWRTWTDYGDEWDVEIQIEQRGPARAVEGSE